MLYLVLVEACKCLVSFFLDYLVYSLAYNGLLFLALNLKLNGFFVGAKTCECELHACLRKNIALRHQWPLGPGKFENKLRVANCFFRKDSAFHIYAL